MPAATQALTTKVASGTPYQLDDKQVIDPELRRIRVFMLIAFYTGPPSLERTSSSRQIRTEGSRRDIHEEDTYWR